ncbi:MAG: HPF/RaiA family ribosome-associated protein [Acidisphaera sp.]|nr:HPF/RaiA family ribosome-associated protein [Acidisphaera sp.]
MERPLEIAFHNMSSSASLEAEIREHVEKLETRYGRLTACRVSVEALHRQHRTGNIFEVHVTMSVPGRELAISREPHRPREHYAHPDVRVSVREAFRAAERQLQAFKAKRGQPEKVVGANAAALAGQVAQIEPGRDHGFILTNTGSQLYFHRDSVTDGRFEELQVGDPVHYVEEEGDAGPTAAKVRIGRRG